MTRVILIGSGKGGVGKTTITANLGIALSLLGEDVLILDMDINMANLELVLGLEGKPVTLQDVLSGKAEIFNAVYEGQGGVKIVPAGLSIPNFKYVKRERLEEVLKRLIGTVDILLLDSPAGLERDALSAMALADEMVLVTTPEVISMSDTLKTKLVADQMGIEILGVVVNREPVSHEFLNSQEIEAILEVPILSIIPENTKLRKLYSQGESILMEEPESKTSINFNRLAKYLLDETTDSANEDDSRGFVSRFINIILGGTLKPRRH